MKKRILVEKIFSEKTINKVDIQISSLKENYKLDKYDFLLSKAILMVIIFFIALVHFKLGYVIAPLLVIVFYFLYDYLIIETKLKKRAQIMEKDAIFFFKVLSLTLQNETNLKRCFEITAESIDSELSKIIRDCLKEMKYGKSLAEALNDAKNKIPSKDVKNVLFNILESNKYGNSIADSLNNQIEYLTDKRILNIKAQINKLPTKISIISVLLFVPIIMLLILGPVIINYFFN